MSDRRWVKALLGLLVLNLSYISGLFYDCSICCVIQNKIRDLNCSWRSDVWTQHLVSLQNLTNPHEAPVLFTVPPGQNWLVILRKDLVMYHEYNITVTGGDKKTEHFTYSYNGRNIFIRPPLLNSSIFGSESLEITWNHPEDEEVAHVPVEVRYRIPGGDNWMEVHDSDLEIDRYVLDDPVPYTDYEFQIRYLPDKNGKRGSLWSESLVITSPELAPNGSTDVWRSLQNGYSLLVMWKPLDHLSARGKILSYLVMYIHGGNETTTEVECCSLILPVQSTQVRVRARNSQGIGPPASVPPLCAEMGNTTVFDCTVRGTSGKINVLCEEMKSDNILSYVIDWREDGKTEVQWSRSQTVSETLVLPGQFTPGALYCISVYVFYINSCIRIFSTEAYSQEEVPTAAPNFTSHILSAGNVLVSWEEIPRWHRKGIISHHTIYVNSKDHSEAHPVPKGSGNKILLGLSSGTVYTIMMTASTSAGEGPQSPQKTFQTTGYRHRVLFIVAVVVIILFICGAILCFSDCKIPLWPKIPKPEDKFKELFLASSVNMWQPQQVSLNPFITVVEEIEPPPQPPTPPPPSPKPSPPSPLLNKAPFISFGYEKHFMPTPEEVMGLR